MSAIDHRDPERREEMFLRSWEFHIRFRTHPGCVYHLLPALARGLDDDERAWAVWLNGNTQNPVTTSLLLDASGHSIVGWREAVSFWNDNFKALEWDTDRRHQKAKFGEATEKFVASVGHRPAEAWARPAAEGWPALWRWVTSLPYMGRLSSWSMAEYARILLPGIPDADTLLLGDASGSRSHRAGLAVVAGSPVPEAAYYEWAQTADRVDELAALGERLLTTMRSRLPDHPDVTRLTLESALCTYKSWHKPNRRYPNVYADMAYGRIRAGERKFGPRFAALWRARAEALPRPLRLEDSPTDPGLCAVKQNYYRLTGAPVMLGHLWPDLWSPFDQAVTEGRFGLRKDVVA